MTAGTIAVCCAEQGRWSRFNVALFNLHRPAGTFVSWQIGSGISANRNGAVLQAMRNRSDWLFFLDDDTLPKPDTLDRLLAHNVDIVGGLYMQRGEITKPEAFTDFRDTAAPLDLGPGLHRMAFVGCGALLIRMRVFLEIEPPWFDFVIEPGQGTQSECGTFGRKAAAAGFEVYCDYSTTLTHLVAAAVEPVVVADGIDVAVDVGARRIVVPRLASA